jgi:hypothetical protein
LESLKRRDHLEDLGVNGSNIEMDVKEFVLEGADLIDVRVAQDRDRWQVVNTAMNLRVA